MKTTDDLHELIHSLSRTEKRYVHLYAGLQKGQKEYMVLFRILDKMPVYDEQELRQQLQGRPMLKNLPIARQYLYEHIIHALREYGAYKDADSHLTDLIEEHKVLEYKGLHRQSARVLHRAAQQAQADEAFLRLYYISIREYIALVYSSGTVKPGDLDAIILRRHRILEQIANYSMISDTVFALKIVLRRRQFAYTDKQKEELRLLMQPLLSMQSHELLSRTARGIYYIGLSDYYNAIGQPEKAIGLMREYLAEEYHRKRLTLEMRTQRCAEISAYITLCLRNLILDDVEQAIEKMRAGIEWPGITGRRSDVEAGLYIFQRWINHKMMYYNCRRDFQAGWQLLQEYSPVLAQWQHTFTEYNRRVLEYARAYMHFCRAEYTQALHSINTLLTGSDTESDEAGFARILELMIHTMLGNQEQLDYFLRNTQHYLRSRHRLYEAEKYMLRILRRIATIMQGPAQGRRRKIQNLCRRALPRMEQITAQTPGKTVLYYLDFATWLRETALSD
jgi:hypothetical protein